ncbi:MAG: arginase family protein [Candidatus Pacearchaeota archaeon]
MIYKVIGISFCSNLKNNREAEKNVNIIKVDEKIEVEKLDKDKGLKEIEEKIKLKEKKAIFVGGDHSITYALVKATKPNMLVIFDAHADLIRPLKTITNEDWLRALINEKILDTKNIVMIGLRNYDKKEEYFIRDNNIPCIFLDKEGIELTLDDITDFIMEKMKEKEKIYLSIDIDFINGCEIEANFKEPFGFSSREFFYILKRISKLKEKIDFIDIVEGFASDEKTRKIIEKIIEIFNQK